MYEDELREITQDFLALLEADRDQHHRWRQQLQDYKCDFAALRVKMAAFKVIYTMKAGYNEEEPRDHGKWTTGLDTTPDAPDPPPLVDPPDTLDEDDLTQLAQARTPGIRVQVGSGFMDATPAETTRLGVAEGEVRSTRNQLSELDPTWRPAPRLTDPNSVEGEISRLEAIAKEGQSRLDELAREGRCDPADPDGRPGTTGWLASRVNDPIYTDAYRSIVQMPELDGREATARSEGTVTFYGSNGQLMFGVNSRSPAFTSKDYEMASEARDQLVEADPDLMATDNLGQKPNDALFHAEANALLRAADQNGGSLAGQTIIMRSDRELCRSCETVLPSLTKQLGSPDVLIKDGAGAHWMIQNGVWTLRAR